MRRIAGLISDTHGLLRPEVFRVFKGVDVILHAGDIGKPEILEHLQTIAPVIAVRGNNDKGGWAKRLPASRIAEIGTVRVFIIHDLKEQKTELQTDDVEVVVSGHSHHPLIERRGHILFINPGSAGPRRFTLPVSVARLTIQGTRVNAKLVTVV
jgi:uncharacterized protein